MKKFALTGLFLLSSVAYISGAEQKKYEVTINDIFRDVLHTYKMMFTSEDLKDIPVMKQFINNYGRIEWLNKGSLPNSMVYIPNVTATEINTILSNCEVHLFCMNKYDGGKILKIEDPAASKALDRDTHELRAMVYRGVK
jgi:hypothetical protein